MGSARRHYDEEFKRNAVDLCHTRGKSISEIAKDLGIGCSMLARWKREQEEYKYNAFPCLCKVRRGTDLKDKTASLRIS